MFDRVVVVDWSAGSTPKRGKDSIWIAECAVATGAVRSANIATRAAAVGLLIELTSLRDRCLVGVDFSLGFPSGTAAALGLPGEPWRSTWDLLAELIVDDSENRNNRFEVASRLNREISGATGPFWGCPASRRTEWLTTTKVPSAPLTEWRRVETVLRNRGHRPFSAWQLLGAGAVGSQSLLGIASLHPLLATVDVWPFTCGLAVPTADTVVVEVWPSLLTLPDAAGRVRDRVQVETLSADLAERIRAGAIVGDLVPEVGPWRSEVEHEEGWVLGA